MLNKRPKWISLLICLIFPMFSSDSYCQTLCDGTMPDSAREIFVQLENMPKPSISIDHMESQLNSSLNPSDFGLEEGMRFYLNFIVNCRGETFRYKLLRNDNKNLEAFLINYFRTSIIWEPGTLIRNVRGKRTAVAHDVSLTYSFRIDNGLINILEGKEFNHNRKSKKRKKKKD